MLRINISKALNLIVAGGIATVGVGVGSAQTTYNVVTCCGADSTGSTDSTKAIQKAIKDAQGGTGNTVYFPPGVYVLKGADSQEYDLKIDTTAITVMGDGPNDVTIVEEHGASAAGGSFTVGRTLFDIKSGASGTGGADGTVIKGLTLISGIYEGVEYDGGTLINDGANNTTLENLVIYGGLSDGSYNSGQMGIRVEAVCNPTNYTTVFRSGNKVENVTLYGMGKAGNVDLDISCQHGAQVSNIIDTGNGIDIYQAQNTSIDTYTYYGPYNGVQSNPFFWVITAPADSTSLTNVTTYAQGGVIEPSPSYVVTNTTISNEQMMNANSMYLLLFGDANNTTISNSTINQISFDPDEGVAGVTVTASTIGSVTCNNPSIITGLVGISCP